MSNLPVEADETQARIRRERAQVQRYANALFEDLQGAQGEQIDRHAPATDPLDVAEHERPALALSEEAKQAERVRGLKFAASQQSGIGHPFVARCIEQPSGAPAPDATRPVLIV